MPVYICRWPNGDVSVVSAPTRDKAEYMLDEVDDASQAEMIVARHFMELQGWGESFETQLGETCYPVYTKAALVDDPTEAELVLALEQERERVKPDSIRLSSDPELRAIQTEDPDCTVNVVMAQYVRDFRHRESSDRETF